MLVIPQDPFLLAEGGVLQHDTPAPTDAAAAARCFDAV